MSAHTETIFTCDLCGNEISPAKEEPFVIEKMRRKDKQIGCDIELTPKGNRMYAMGGKAMIRVMGSFWCGVTPKDTVEMHFHSECLDKEVRQRVVQMFERR